MNAVTSIQRYMCAKCQEGFRAPVPVCHVCGHRVIIRTPDGARTTAREERKPVSLAALELGPEEPRTLLGVPALDEVLGGGAVKGYSVLFAGGEGLGKSTLLLEAACRSGLRSLFLTSEEDEKRIGARRLRLGLPGSCDALRIESGEEGLAAAAGYELAILDSVQTTGFELCPPGHAQGSLALVRAFHDWALRSHAIVFLVCHETKEGDYAGPRALAHAVDCTLGLGWPKELEEDAFDDERLLFATKNRAGPAPKKVRVLLMSEGFQKVGT